MDTILNAEKRKLVEDHLYLISAILRTAIRPNESIPDLSYDDLYQTGCLALCHAASRYDKDRGASFATFATKVVKNALISCCRQAAYRQEKLEYLDAPLQDGENLTYADLLADEKAAFTTNTDTEILDLLTCAEKRSSGVTGKGIISLKLRCMGYTNPDIAAIYGTRSNHVAAWISKAARFLREDKDFLYRLSA